MASHHTAAIYCRISRDQAGDGEGVERQEESCRELAKRLGIEVVAVYRDNDIGASDRTSHRKVRDGYREMLLDAKAGEFTRILAYSNSRLTRRLSELDDFVQLAKEPYSIRVHTVVSGDDDLSTADGLMVARIKASVDAHESDRISERQKAAFQYRALQGKPKLQRQRPFGWQQDGVTIEPEEAARIREGLADVLAGASLSSVAKKWEKAGVLTAAGGTKWEYSVIHRVVLGWRTAGVRTYKREPLKDESGAYVRGTWEPIITLEERQAGLNMIAKRKLTKTREGHWLLSGLVFCECGAKAYGQLKPKAQHNTYACRNGHVAINAARLEEYLYYSLFARLTNKAVEADSSSQGPTSSAPEEFPEEERITVLDRKISELREAYNADILDGSVYIPQVQALTNELTDLRRARERWQAERAEPTRTLDRNQSPEDFGAALQAFALNLASTNFDELRPTVERELESIIVKRGVRGRHLRGKSEEDGMRAIEERVELVWRSRLR